MSFVSMGDLAQDFQLRRQNSVLKSEISRLSGEMASGKVSDPSTALSGDFTSLGEIEKSLTVLGAYDITNNEAGVVAGAVQTVLLTIQSSSSDLGPALLAAGNSSQPSIIRTISSDAREKLDGAISRLNMQVAGRSLFAGAAVDQPAVADGDVIMADVMTALAGLTTASDIAAAVDGWFAPGGGYDTIGYRGSLTPTTGFQIAPGEQAQLKVTAADASLRGILKGFVLSSVVADGGLAGQPAEASKLMGLAGEQLISAQDDLAVLQSAVGSVEGRIEDASVANRAERASLEIARNKMLGIDPYQAATRLEATRTQLETLYALTARFSRMSLVDFLR